MRKSVSLSIVVLSLALGLIPFRATAAEPDKESLRKALAFHAGFDGDADADFARGDKRVYTATNWEGKSRLDSAKPGLHRADVTIAKGQGKYGDALRFGKKTRGTIFYMGDKNMAYRPKDWSGTVSFWLRLNPDKDLQPGYCDPVQITDKEWNDAAFFVDFTKDEKPRHFRLGIYSDLRAWNPKNLNFDTMPSADKPFSEPVTKPPFDSDKWTHVLFTYSGLNTGKPDAVGQLYLDGKPAASIRNRPLTFTWDPSRVMIMIGLYYIGLYDDLAVFDRALTADEVSYLYRLDGGVSSLVR